MSKHNGMTVEKFADQLKSRVEQMGPSRGGYVLANDLKDAIDSALKQADPATVGFPKMLFEQGNRDRYRIVNNRAEETIALSQGYTHQLKPAYEAGFPKIYAETRGNDRRRIEVLTPAQEGEFLAATDNGQGWKRDDQFQLGARGVFLHDILQEHREKLKQVLDSMPLREVENPSPKE